MSGCDDKYIGEGCNVVKQTLRDSTLIFMEDNGVVILTITDIKYMTELVNEYVIQYKLLHEDNFISIKVSSISERKRREAGEDDVMLKIPFSDLSINSQYGFVLVPLISSSEYNGVVGVSSEFTPYNSGCLQYTGLPSCNHWCVCRDDPGTLCILTCSGVARGGHLPPGAARRGASAPRRRPEGGAKILPRIFFKFI